MQLHILYWNVANSKENAEAALRESSGPDIVALQEPHVNRNNNAVYCNELYHRIYDSGRAALYIHKRHAIAAWTQRAGTDWCSVLRPRRERPGRTTEVQGTRQRG